MRESYRSREHSAVADAYRRLRDGSWRIDEIEELATTIAEAEGHRDLERVIRRELGPLEEEPG